MAEYVKSLYSYEEVRLTDKYNNDIIENNNKWKVEKWLDNGKTAYVKSKHNGHWFFLKDEWELWEEPYQIKFDMELFEF